MQGEVWADRAAEACTHDHDHLAVDGCLWGNASRYFNSSCDPNMAIWPVWLSSRDFRHYHPSFFTIRDVEAGEELTFRYSGKDKSNIKKATQKQKQNEDARRLADSDVEGEAEQDEAAQDDDAPAEPELEPIYCRCGAANCKKALLFDVAGPPQVRAAKQKQLRKELQHIEARSEHGGEAE
jgi:SET domain-containing protein